MGIELRGKNGAIDLSLKMIKGDDGGYYIPSIDSDGNLTWAPSETEMPAVEGANIKGQKGDTGTSGVWVGDTEPTGDYNVWIDPTGSETTGLVTKAELATKQDKLTAGTNITIDSNNIISATGLVTQAELASKQDKLTVGDNITIENNVISASAPPTATTSTLGLVKPDGTSITIADGVISSIQPTKTSELTNDSGFITNEYHDPAKQDKLVAGDNITLADDGTISASQPTKTSELTNDSGFITNEYHDATKQDKLTAGTNITIDSNNVISATGSGGGGSSYTFTDGLTETDGVVKWDLNDIIKKSRTNNVIISDGANTDFYVGNVTKGNIFAGNGNGKTNGIYVYNSDNEQYWPNRNNIVIGYIRNGSGEVGVHGNGQTANLLIGSVRDGGIVATNGGSYGGGSIIHGHASEGSIVAVGASSGSLVGGNTNGRSSEIRSDSYGAIVHGYAKDSSIVVDSVSFGATALGYARGGNIKVTGCGAFGSGCGIEVNGRAQFVNGEFNIKDTLADNGYSIGTYINIIGNGTSDTSRSNAYTLDWQGNGTYAGTVSSSTGANYAEYFEWKDGNPNNEDRVGYIVTLDGDKIVKANSGDDILGICSGTAMVLGDSAEWNWSKRYLTDDFGRIIYEDYDVEHEEVKDKNTGKVLEEAWTEHIHAPKQNPNYDISQPYIRRSDRPEWQIVGMMGKLYVRDDGSCEINGYADVINGIATKANGKTNMRVMERINDSIVRVLLK